MKGKILFYPNYKFPEGNVNDKFFIGLNNPDVEQDEPYLFALTTSQTKNKIQTKGCHSERGYYVITQDDRAWFDKYPTFVKFDELIIVSANSFIQQSINNNSWQEKGTIGDKLLRSIINCVIQCTDVPNLYKKILRVV